MDWVVQIRLKTIQSHIIHGFVRMRDLGCGGKVVNSQKKQTGKETISKTKVKISVVGRSSFSLNVWN